jgi:hypothetical protein
MLVDSSSNSHSIDINDDNLSECTNFNKDTHLITSKNANEPTISVSICPPIIQLSSRILNNEQHFKNNPLTFNFIENSDQSKWHSNTRKYHIESLLQ